MKITIKRATSTGLVEATGILIEAHGYQFCLTKVKDEALIFLIELSSGGNAKSFNFSEYTMKKATERSKLLLDNMSKANIDEGIKEFKRIFGKEYGYQFPVNEPVKAK